MNGTAGGFALLRLALRQLRREARAGELRVLFLALLIAVAASTAIGHFTDRLNGAMRLRASEFLGADLVLRGSAPAAQAQIEAGRRLGLDPARSVEFASVLATDSALQLASVKAVDAGYPLRGELRSAARPFGSERGGGRPAPGEAWAEARLLVALGLNIGDSIEVGRQRLRLSRVLTYEPDRAGDFYSLTPRLLINLADLDATGVVQPGSRVIYRDFWRGEAAALAAYREAVSPGLAAHQQLQDPRDGSRQIGGALQRAERYLGLASLAAVLLAGVAVALSASRFASRRYDFAALLRCLGLSRALALRLFALQLLLLGLLACLAGIILGSLAQAGLFQLLAGLLPAQIPAPGWRPALLGAAVGMVALAGFALPPLAALGRVAPLRVLRRDLAPLPLSSLSAYACALLALALIMWWLSLDLALTLALLAGGLLACLLLGGLWLLLLRGLRRLLGNAGLAWRLGLGQLLRHPLAAVGQSLAFGLILLAMALVLLLRNELLDNWQRQLPDDAPNHFALNILAEEREAFAAHLERLQASRAPLYPVAPGRLVSINAEPVRQRVSKESRGERAVQRDLSLTWSSALDDGSRLVAGQWWDSLPAGHGPAVSVEAELARSLGLRLGDRLGFDIGGQPLEARVTSLREVDWESFRPNFYMVFDPATQADFAVTYLTSFHLPAAQATELVELARAFPSITLLQVDALLAQLRSILAQVSLAVEFVLLFVLAAGIVVLLAGLQATLDERIRQGALLRALGAERRLLQRARLGEFAVLGASSGLLAALGCELASLLLYRLVFDLPWQPHPALLLLLPVGALLVAAAGLSGTRRVLRESPLGVLRGD